MVGGCRVEVFDRAGSLQAAIYPIEHNGDNSTAALSSQPRLLAGKIRADVRFGQADAAETPHLHALVRTKTDVGFTASRDWSQCSANFLGSKGDGTDPRLSVQEAPQRLACRAPPPGHAGIRRAIEPVKRSRVHVKFDRHTGPAQSIRIGHVFFEEEVKAADRNVGWRQTRHIRRARGRRVRRDAGRTDSSPSSERQPK